MKPARARRFGAPPSIGLAFLDVLCCGLGSAVFLLLVIQHGPAPVAAEALLVGHEIDRVEADLEATNQRIGGVQNTLATAADTIRAALAAIQQVAGLSELQQRQADDALASLGEARQRLDDETVALADLRAQSAPPPTTPRQHLTGLRVDEDRVAVFLDSSASMLDSSLVGILRLRVSADRLKRASDKWTTARNAAKWVYRRIPDGGRYRLFHYADGLAEMRGGAVSAGPISWRQKSASQVASPAVESAVDALVPGGPTDLRQVFETAARLSPPAAQIVLITDGLPTLPGDTPLHRIRHCKRPRRNATPLITAECRASIFQDAVAVGQRALSNVRIDIILLPLEGDANAAVRYWDLALSFGGRLLTPARGWPEP